MPVSNIKSQIISNTKSQIPNNQIEGYENSGTTANDYRLDLYYSPKILCKGKNRASQRGAIFT